MTVTRTAGMINAGAGGWVMCVWVGGWGVMGEGGEDERSHQSFIRKWLAVVSL